MPLLPSMKAKLPDVLCLKVERTVGNDNLRRLPGKEAPDPAAAVPLPLRAGQGDRPRVRGWRDGGLPRYPKAGALRRCRPGGWTRPGRPRESFRRPPRLASLAWSGGGTPKRPLHVLRKPATLFAPDTAPSSPCATASGPRLLLTRFSCLAPASRIRGPGGGLVEHPELSNSVPLPKAV